MASTRAGPNDNSEEIPLDYDLNLDLDESASDSSPAQLLRPDAHIQNAPDLSGVRGPHIDDRPPQKSLLGRPPEDSRRQHVGRYAHSAPAPVPASLLGPGKADVAGFLRNLFAPAVQAVRSSSGGPQGAKEGAQGLTHAHTGLKSEASAAAPVHHPSPSQRQEGGGAAGRDRKKHKSGHSEKPGEEFLNKVKKAVKFSLLTYYVRPGTDSSSTGRGDVIYNTADFKRIGRKLVEKAMGKLSLSQPSSSDSRAHVQYERHVHGRAVKDMVARYMSERGRAYEDRARGGEGSSALRGLSELRG